MWKRVCDWFGVADADEDAPHGQQQFIGRILKLGDMEVTVNSVIGEGGFGTVFQVSETAASQNMFALKKLLAHDRQEFKTIMKEVNILKHLWKDNVCSCEHIVKFKFAYCSDQEKTPIEVLVLTELCVGNLHDIVVGRDEGLVKEDIVRYFSQASDAVEFLHEQSPQIIHRDIKPENFLISRGDGALRLCDFGSCTTKTIDPASMNYKEKTLAQENIAAVTTPTTRSPEMIDLFSNQPINEKVDVWVCCFSRIPFHLFVLFVQLTFINLLLLLLLLLLNRRLGVCSIFSAIGFTPSTLHLLLRL
eukprot:m.30921 g.30921  ORF g.30921 m.30921 type:complete len:304 (-) comp9677_c0_seq2:144-1055(-)